MRVFLMTLEGQLCPIDIEPSDDFLTARTKMEEQVGVDRWASRLIYCGKRLDPYCGKVSDYNIQEGAIIHIIHRGPLERRSK